MAFSPFERMVAGRYLRARRKEGFVSVIVGFSFLGIMLGVATLIIVMSVMNGFRTELLGRILGLNGHIAVYAAAGGPLAGFDTVAERLREVPGVIGVRPIIEGQAMATRKGVAGGVQVRGLRAADFASQPIIARNIVAGSLSEFEGGDRGAGIAIGVRLARRYGVGPGDSITLIAPETQATAFGSVPRIKSYRIAAVFDVGMYEYDSAYVYMPFDAASAFFRTGGGASAVEVMLPDADSVGAARGRVQQALSALPVTLVDWRQAHASFFNAVEVERNVMFLILTLIILVAAFNVISGMIMMVKDKGRDIAILRTMGATRAMIMRIFLMTGASVGVAGTFAGLVLGVVFARNIETIRHWIEALTGSNVFAAEIYFLSRLPAEIDNAEVAMIVAMALALSFLATIYPSWRAARLDPVEALRYE